MSDFNAQEFLNAQNDGGKFESTFTPIPAGEYIAMISKVDAKQQPKTDGTGVWTIVDINLRIDDAAAKEATGMQEPFIKDSLFLDIDEATKKLATGKNKNIGLGRYLDATGQNGQPGNPFHNLLGKMVKVTVAVEPDKKNPSNLYSRVKAIGKAM